MRNAKTTCYTSPRTSLRTRQSECRAIKSHVGRARLFAPDIPPELSGNDKAVARFTQAHIHPQTLLPMTRSALPISSPFLPQRHVWR